MESVGIALICENHYDAPGWEIDRALSLCFWLFIYVPYSERRKATTALKCGTVEVSSSPHLRFRIAGP